ncbi:MAG: hypothetical protein WBA35_09650 [Litorimonas sp.]
MKWRCAKLFNRDAVSIHYGYVWPIDAGDQGNMVRIEIVRLADVMRRGR